MTPPKTWKEPAMDDTQMLDQIARAARRDAPTTADVMRSFGQKQLLRRSRRRQQMTLIGVAAVVVAIAAGAWAIPHWLAAPQQAQVVAAASTASPTDYRLVWCYANATLDESQRTSLMLVDRSGRPGSETVSDYVNMCAEMWSSGEISSTAPYFAMARGEAPLGPVGERPTLTGCVLPDGKLGIFPVSQEETCVALGLPLAV